MGQASQLPRCFGKEYIFNNYDLEKNEVDDSKAILRDIIFKRVDAPLEAQQEISSSDDEQEGDMEAFPSIETIEDTE